MPLKLNVITVSTRPGRVGPKVAAWFHGLAKAHGGFEVEAVDLDPASRRVTRIVVRRGRLFRTETTVPAGVIASVTDARITLRTPADELKKLERGVRGELGRAPAA